jgi:curli production assembly/transport component CsgG
MLMKFGAAAFAALALSGCAMTTPHLSNSPAASLEPETRTTPSLRDLPAPAKPIDVAVYDFPDLTGQAKPNPSFAEYSRAVTQGAGSILIDVLTTVGNGTWFRVSERSGLKDLVQERTLIENTNKSYNTGIGPLPPVRFAGILLEGGVIGYDSDMITGGAGAKFFGIGANTKYRSDVVTVNIRAVSVQTGEVLASATTAKDIFSYENDTGTYVYTAADHLLEIDAGFSQNDPAQLAVREAVELAVYKLIVDGLRTNLWHLANPALQQSLIANFDAQYKQLPPLPDLHTYPTKPTKVAAGK